MGQESTGAQPDRVELYNATAGNFVIGAAKAILGSVLVVIALIALAVRTLEEQELLQIAGLLLPGLVLLAIGWIDLRRCADRSVKVVIDQQGLRDHRTGLAIPWRAVTGVTYSPKTTPASSAMLRLSLCPFALSGLAKQDLPKPLAAWPGGKNTVLLELTSLNYSRDHVLDVIARLGGVPKV